jgi:hypothetical protein
VAKAEVRLVHEPPPEGGGYKVPRALRMLGRLDCVQQPRFQAWLQGSS